MWPGAEPKRRSRSLAISAASAAAAPPADRGHLAVAGAGDVADREGGRAPVAAPPCGGERGERFGGRVRHPVGGGEQDRRPDRRRHQHRGGDRPRPVVFADQGHRRRALGGGGGGEDGERHRGGVGGRVRAADPGRVVGREGGVAELLRRSAAAGVGPPAAAAARRRRGGRRRWSLFGPPPLPPRTAATMKTTASTTSAGEQLRRQGRPARRRAPARGFGGFARRSAAPAGAPRALAGSLRTGSARRRGAGTSALIGRSALTAANATWACRDRTALRPEPSGKVSATG